MAPDSASKKASNTRRWLVLGGLAALAVAALLTRGFGLMDAGTGAQSVTYRFAEVSRGPVRTVVSASGSVRPVVMVLVGSQVSGQIAELLVDFNSAVKQGEVIARLDPATFQARVWQAEADLKVQEANVGMQEASLIEMAAEVDGAKAALDNAAQDFKRKKELLERKVVAPSVVDTAIALRDQAAAKLRAVKARQMMQGAQVKNAKALVDERRAQLKQRQLDLDNSIIRSPVDGVVISRSVDVGQTVAASLQAPTLFTIAQDLRKMQVEVSVDEADIGRIFDNQKVVFTVDSFPGREFAGHVKQVRKAPTEISNVVTYTVVVAADNPDLSLLPGMTANVSVVIGERDEALRVPAAALRYQPPAAGNTAATSANAGRATDRLVERLKKQLDLKPEQENAVREAFAEVGKKVRAMREAGASADEVNAARDKLRQQARERAAEALDTKQREKYWELVKERAKRQTTRGRAWIVGKDGKPEAVSIVTGISDGALTEVVSGELQPGQKVITGQSAAPKDSGRRRSFGF
jgi:HlyD family secretion protein